MAGSIASKACHAHQCSMVESPEAVNKVFFEEHGSGGGGSGSQSGPGENLGMTRTGSNETNSPKRSSRFAPLKGRELAEGSNVDAALTTTAAAGGTHDPSSKSPASSNILTIGLCLSRRDAVLGHSDTVTRQTAFDFNELQDRTYTYVSSTDPSGWLAGGGEKGNNNDTTDHPSNHPKLPAPDRVHIPILQIHPESEAVTDEIISALARGEVFIPHMAILPEALSVTGSSLPDLVVRFDCEKNDDANPEDWPNWCLEFLHNQLYDLFESRGARWTKRPFQITLARKVKWKTVKHMNKYFANAERVVNTWREKGPRFCQPPESTSFLGATHEEIAKPHGIYLLRDGVPTNYFAPNFQPPYTTKVTRSLIRNVINKSWDSKRRDWLLEPIPRSVGPLRVIRTVFGCASDTNQLSPVESHAVFDLTHDLESFDMVTGHHESGGGGSRKGQVGNNSSPGRRRKETIDNNAAAATDVLVKHNDSPRRTLGEGAMTSSIPSDESFGVSSSKPCETASIEETITESTTDGLTQPSIESTTASSTQYSKSTVTSSRQSSRDEVDQDLFSPKANPQRKKQVIREEKPMFHNNNKAAHYSIEQQQQQRHLNVKIEDTKAEKFAKTKVSKVVGDISLQFALLFSFFSA